MGTAKFIWDGQNVLMETDAANASNAVYTARPAGYGSMLSQRRKSGAVWTPSYYHFDQLGTAAALTSSAQATTDTYKYRAFGESLATTGTTKNAFRYVGALQYYFDSDLAQYYVRRRVYLPTIARWLSADPLGFADGMNRFAYVRGGPTQSVDPSGLLELFIIRWLRDLPAGGFIIVYTDGSSASGQTASELATELKDAAAKCKTIDEMVIKGHGGKSGDEGKKVGRGDPGFQGGIQDDNENPFVIGMNNEIEVNYENMTGLLRRITNENTEISFRGCHTDSLADFVAWRLNNSASVSGFPWVVVNIPGTMGVFLPRWNTYQYPDPREVRSERIINYLLYLEGLCLPLPNRVYFVP